MADGPSVPFQVSGRKPLVGRVQKREVIALLDNLRDLFPLLVSGVAAGRVVGTGVEDDY